MELAQVQPQEQESGMINQLRSRLGHAAAVIALSMGFGGAGLMESASASADAPAPNVNFVMGIANANASANLTLNANAKTSVIGNVVIGEDVHPGAAIPAEGCHFYKNFTNTEEGANGQLIPFEDHNAELCPNPNKKEREEGYPDIKVKGGESGRDCGNPARPIVAPHLVTKVLTLPKLDIEVNIEGSAEAIADSACSSGESELQVHEQVNLLTLLRMSAAKQRKLLANLKKSITGETSASAVCAPVAPVAPITPITPIIPPTPLQPQPVPGISIQKTFEGSYESDGTEYSTVATKHGDTDEWMINVANTGQDTLNASYLDTPPEGEVVVEESLASFPAQPFGLQVNGEGEGTWNDVLEAGQEDTFYVYTENVDVPCYTNVLNTVDVAGVDAYGVEVTAQAQAYTKEENTGSDCIATAPPVTGPGQPLPTS